jgi:heptaprenyl diphosphate synthase
MTDGIAQNIETISTVPFEGAINLVKEEVNKVMSASPLIIRRYTEHLAWTKGKYIRAQSVLVCSMNRESLVHSSAIKLAAAIEILHLATLVHDDVIDDADVRRGRPTLHKKFGHRTAVICGDYLLSVALRLAASIQNKQQYLDMEISDYTVRICAGELLEQINNGNYDLTVYQYLKIISGKTAALFEASFFAGAVLSGCEQAQLNLYKKLGHYLGMVFQLIDDCMDFEASSDVAQKPVQADFDKDVITLPIIQAFKEEAGLKQKARERSITKEELSQAVYKTGSLKYTRMVARKYYNKYKRILSKMDIIQEKQHGLLEILDNAFRVFKGSMGESI